MTIDLTQVFNHCNAVFGTSVIYEKGGVKYEILGIFTTPPILTAPAGFETEVQSNTVIFEVQESDLDFKPSKNDKITSKMGLFKVVNVETNLLGQLKLSLKKIEKGAIFES